jgi:hypothetical protein
MASEQVLEVLMRRHVFHTERPLTRHVADAGSYAPVTILIQERPDGGTRVAYDSVVSALAPYHDAAASQVAEQLDTEVLDLLRQATGVPASGEGA